MLFYEILTKRIVWCYTRCIMKKLFTFLGLTVVVILLGTLIGLAYIGMIPGVSSFFVKQVDLGIVPDPQQVVEINETIGHEVITSSTPAQSEPVYEGEIEIDGSYSGQQVTSVLDSWSKNYAITPFYNVQVKLHEDGSAEASGMLKIAEAVALAKNLGYSDEQIEIASKYATFVNGDLPVYVAGAVSVVNNQVSVDTSTIKMGNVTLPKYIESQVVVAVEDAVERKIRQVPTVQIQNMDLSGGQLNIAGTVPQLERAE